MGKIRNPRILKRLKEEHVASAFNAARDRRREELDIFAKEAAVASIKDGSRKSRWDGSNIEANWCDASKSGMRMYKIRHHS